MSAREVERQALEDYLIDKRVPDAYDLSTAILASDWLTKEREAAVLDYVTTKETARILIETTEMQQNVIDMAVKTAVAAERERIAKAIEAAVDLGECECGHWIGEHNSLGCYAREYPAPGVTVKCECRLDDDRHEGLLAQAQAANISRATTTTEVGRMADERECLQCGETPATIKRNDLICGIEGGYEYRELEYEWPRHRWADWRDKELARAGIKAAAFDKHRRTPAITLQWVDCEDTRRGHAPADEESVAEMWASRIGQCILCGKQATTTETNEGAR